METNFRWCFSFGFLASLVLSFDSLSSNSKNSSPAFFNILDCFLPWFWSSYLFTECIGSINESFLRWLFKFDSDLFLLWPPPTFASCKFWISSLFNIFYFSSFLLFLKYVPVSFFMNWGVLNLYVFKCMASSYSSSSSLLFACCWFSPCMVSPIPLPPFDSSSSR